MRVNRKSNSSVKIEVNDFEKGGILDQEESLHLAWGEFIGFIKFYNIHTASCYGLPMEIVWDGTFNGSFRLYTFIKHECFAPILDIDQKAQDLQWNKKNYLITPIPQQASICDEEEDLFGLLV